VIPEIWAVRKGERSLRESVIIFVLGLFGFLYVAAISTVIVLLVLSQLARALRWRDEASAQ
jgi:uncharacterized BrkB/YihY/UPF0761 family membrane protein